ncbi:RDD family protein [Microbacterium halophytorum]|uniref:RDD family protein n=1 Tax=Microbacterium halophytorum TaxID=2067568 RepID=UPI00131A43D3|nr:RDD family protein [Microbacterium halophytorum]
MTAIWEVPGDEKDVEGLDADGRPDPAYAAALGLVPAPALRRALAAVTDVAFYLLLQAPFWLFTVPLLAMLLLQEISVYGLVSHPNFLVAMIVAGATVLLTLAFCITQLVLHGRKGVTIGKALFGLRSVNVATLERPGFWRVVLRFLVLMAASIVAIALLVFLLSPLWDSERRGRGWHDRAGGLWMVDVRRGLNPYDEKRMRIARKSATVERAPEAAPLPSLATPRSGHTPQSYRPAGRTSAGVLGVAGPSPERARPAQDPSRSAEHGAAQIVMNVPDGLLGAPPAQPAPLPPAAPMPRSRGERPAAHEPLAPAARPAAPAAPTAARTFSPAAPGPPAPRPAYAITLDTGQRIALAGAALVGRDPRALGEYEAAALIAVADEGRSISKTHLAVRATPRGVEVIDLHSTNGTSITHGGAEHPLPPSQSGLAQIGDTVRFGDRTLTIGRPETD